MARRHKWIPALGWLLLVAAVADLVALKTGVIRHSPSVLAVLFGAAMLFFGARLCQLVGRLATRQEGRATHVAELLLVGGIMGTLLAGTANWLLGLQGAVILREDEVLQLHGGTALQIFEAGPMARLEEMGVFMALDELELVAVGEGGYSPVSHLRVWQEGDEVASLEVTAQEWDEFETLRFHQGAFGFAPRIVILEDGKTIFDQEVPFRSQRHGVSGVAFEQRFTVESERLEVEGRIDLASLDEGMRGHATLELAMVRSGAALGRGQLLPGHFAEIEEGFRVGFAGLGKWSEIDISRRDYSAWMKVSAVIALLGALIWPVARWRQP